MKQKTIRRSWQASTPCPCCRAKWSIKYDRIPSGEVKGYTILVQQIHKLCKCQIKIDDILPVVQRAAEEHAANL